MSLIRKSDVKNHLSPRDRTTDPSCARPKASPMQPAFPEPNRTQSRQIRRLSLRISPRNIRRLLNPLHRPIFSPDALIRGCPSHRKARKREAAFCFPAQGVHPAGSFGSAREPVGEHWTLVEEITAPVFDTMIRQQGWHFLWMHRPSRRRGFGLTREEATERALTGALKGVAKRFNAAELDSVQVRDTWAFTSQTSHCNPARSSNTLRWKMPQSGNDWPFPRDKPSVAMRESRALSLYRVSACRSCSVSQAPTESRLKRG